ncbi:MAG: tetratricopeptide repeat protein [Bdellovibrionota bacterium]
MFMVVLRFTLALSLFTLISACSHHTENSQGIKLTQEQSDEMNREALSIASERLERMVMEAKKSATATTYLSTDLFLKGNMSLMEGDFVTASVLFKHLTFLVPDDEFVLKKYAVSLIRVGDLETAQGVLEKMYLKRHDEKAGLILAGVYAGLDKEKESREIYHAILKKNPQNEDACVFLSKSYAIGKENAKAFAQLSACAKADPKNGMYDYYAGKIHLDAENMPAAIASFKKSFERQPGHTQAVNALGVIYEETEKFPEAAALYKKHLDVSPNDSVILNRMVHVLFQQEKFDQVITYAEKLADLEPDNLNLKVKLGILYTDAKQYPEALSIFKDLLSVAPASDKILYYLGAIHQELKQFQESIEYFNQIPSSSGLYSDSSLQMANMLSTMAQEEHFAKAGTQWRDSFLKHVNGKLEEIKTLTVELSVIKSGYYEGIGAYKTAMESMMVVQDEKSFGIQHKYYLANLYEKEKRFDDSSALIMTIIDKDPKNAHAWNFLGYSLLVRGEKMDVAYEYIKKAHDLSPDDGYIRDSLGWYYYKTGNVKKALKELDHAHKKVPDDIEILKHLALIHEELKDFSKAKNYLENALKHARYKSDREEILSRIESLAGDRIPASKNID